MSERRPPTTPGRPSSRSAGRSSRRGHERSIHDEHTDIAPAAVPRPALHSREGFDQGAETTSAFHQVESADISLIDADEVGPAPSDPGFADPPRAGVFVSPPAGFEGAPFGAGRPTTDETSHGTDLSTDSMKSAERPIEVRKWKIGGEETPRSAPSPAPGPSQPSRIRTSVVPLPPTDHGEPERAGPDLVELRRLLKDAEQLLTELSVHLSSREGQGAKAQLSAARHRLAEALALLRRA